ncbi:hypothetical protein [Burkholderia ubonensis]|nr:hypothetical protein [Burkholderia ubonensis]
MKLRARRLRWKTMMLRGPGAWRRIPRTRKVLVLQVFENVGHDEHNCWDEYLIAWFK